MTWSGGRSILKSIVLLSKKLCIKVTPIYTSVPEIYTSVPEIYTSVPEISSLKQLELN